MGERGRRVRERQFDRGYFFENGGVGSAWLYRVRYWIPRVPSLLRRWLAKILIE